MRYVLRLLAAAALLGPGTTSAAQDAEGWRPAPDGTDATFVDRDGAEIGAASIVDLPAGGALIGLRIEGLPASSWVGFHVHETGTCDPGDGFDSAGGHFNPDEAEHGFLAEGGPHAGDMPNQFVPESGVLQAQVLNPELTLDGEGASLRGRALIVHADPDDYTSQPSGDAGERIACAVIE